MSVRNSGKQRADPSGPTSSNQQKGAMVPFPVNPSSTAPLVSKFQVLGTIPKPYNSVLASQPKPVDPFGCVQTVNPRPNTSQNSPYIPISQQNLFHIEPHMKFKEDPVRLAAQFFPPGWHFLPMATFKNLAYYKDILVQTESVFIKPIYDRNDSSKAIYHSLYIKQIIVMADWGNHPSDLKQLDNQDLQFNYYDYIEAWDNIFLYQTQSFGHSWFVQFDQKFKSHFPVWFNRWWSRHGSDLEIFPQELENAVTHFSCKCPHNPQFDSVPITLQFVSKYKVPWILKWQYEMHTPTIEIEFKSDINPSSATTSICSVPTVVRLFFIKWWDKIDVSKIVGYVLKEFPIKSVTPVRSIPTKGSSSKSKEVTAGSGLFDVSDIQNCSAAELKLIAQALHRRTEKLQEEASASSSNSVNEDEEQFTVNLQDAQDPFA